MLSNSIYPQKSVSSKIEENCFKSTENRYINRRDQWIIKQ